MEQVTRGREGEGDSTGTGTGTGTGGSREEEDSHFTLPLSSTSSTSSTSFSTSSSTKLSTSSNTNSIMWKCQGALFFHGPNSSQEGAIAMDYTDMAPVYLPDCNLQLIGSNFRHFKTKLLISNIQNQLSSKLPKKSMNAFFIQQSYRAQILDTYLHSSPSKVHQQSIASAGKAVAQLLPYGNYSRTKKSTNKPQIKPLSSRDSRKKLIDVDDPYRRKNSLFLKTVMAHREEFLKYHKNKRNECLKTAKAVKVHFESLELKREKEDVKAESLRLQALKANDMAAYVKLVQETKNVRLQYLLSQTDSYIAKIQEMIKNHGYQQPPTQNEMEKSDAFSTSFVETSEKVVQPSLLKGDLKGYQVAGLQWLVGLYNRGLNGILADEMGLGKTIQTLSLLAYLVEYKFNKGPFLVLVPLSTLSNWVNEGIKWVPHLKKVVYRGNPNTRRQIYKDEVEAGNFNIMFTTYEYCLKDKTYLRKIRWEYIIVDEGHRMKNAQSKFTQTLGKEYKAKHKLLLTGTPLQNNLPELWSLLNFLLPSIFDSVDTFDEWFNKPFASFKSNSSTTSADEGTNEDGSQFQLTQEEKLLIIHRLHEVLRPFMLRRIKSEVLDQLPEKVEVTLRCDLSEWQRHLYKLIHDKAKQMKDSVGNISDKGIGVNNIIMQLRKVCNHPYLFLNDWMIDNDLIRASGKFELLNRILPKLKAAGHRILLFSQMTQVMTILERFFDMKRYRYLRLDGSTAADEREKRMYEFNDPDSPYFIFLLSTRAGGLGLNLASANIVILFDSDWNPMMDLQAQDRAHRIGQKSDVRVIRLVTTSIIEERILARATDKKAMSGLVVEAGKFSRSEDSPVDSKAMMEELLKEYGDGNDAEEEGEETVIPDNDQLNELLAIHDSEIELYRKLDQEHAATMMHEKGALMALDELPHWVKHEDTWQHKYVQLYSKFMKSFGSNEQNDDSSSVISDADEKFRKRKPVTYTDGLTERQFLNYCEKGEAIEPGTLVEKRVRKSSAKLPDDSSSSLLTDSVRSEVLKIVTSLSKLRTVEGFLLYELFLDKPDKKIYPDYYQYISEPISLKCIGTKLRKKRYSSIEQIKADFDIMAMNAKLYNGDQSPVHLLCIQLQDAFLSQLSRIESEILPERSLQTESDNESVSQATGDLPQKKRKFTLKLGKETTEENQPSKLSLALPTALFKKKTTTPTSVKEGQVDSEEEETDSTVSFDSYISTKSNRKTR